MHPSNHPGMSGQGDTAFPGGPPRPGHMTLGIGIGSPGHVPTETGAIADLRTTTGRVPHIPPAVRPLARPPCATDQCQQSIESAWFSWLEVNNPTIQFGNSAWFGLRKINVAQWLSQEVRVLGLHYRLLPMDVAGVGFAGMSTPLAWGDAAGIGAAIVIGTDLDIDLGIWKNKPAWVCGVNVASTIPLWQRNSGNVTTPAGLVPGSPQMPRYLFGPLRFPTGQLSDVSPNVAESDISLQGDCAPVLFGESLDVALVVDRQWINGRTGQIAGFAQVDIVLGHTMNYKPFTN